MSKKNKKNGFRADDKEIKRIEKMMERKEKKELSMWLKRWRKEGRFWDKKSRQGKLIF